MTLSYHQQLFLGQILSQLSLRGMAVSSVLANHVTEGKKAWLLARDGWGVRSDRQGWMKLFPDEILEALVTKIDVGHPDLCWLSTNNSDRYTQFTVARCPVRAHVLVYDLWYGLPEGHGHAEHVRHLCGHDKCCNPRHLAYGAASANIEDQFALGHRQHRAIPNHDRVCPCGRQFHSREPHNAYCSWACYLKYRKTYAPAPDPA